MSCGRWYWPFGHGDMEPESSKVLDSSVPRKCSALRIYNTLNPGWPFFDVTTPWKNGIFLMDVTLFLFSWCIDVIKAHFLGNHFLSLWKFRRPNPLQFSTTRVYTKTPNDKVALSHPGFKYKAHVTHKWVSKTREECILVCVYVRLCVCPCKRWGKGGKERAGTWAFRIVTD